MLAEDLRKAVLQAAIQGNLVEQRLDEGDSDTLFNLIQEEQVRLIRDGIIKRTKPLPPIKEEEILFEIPKNWRWVRLGEISTVISKGTTPSKKKGERYIEGGVRFLRVENIGKDFTLDTTVTKYIPEILHDTELNRSIMQENDVLISIAGALGRTAIIEKKHLPCNINQAISFVRLYPAYIYAHYIKYILNAPVIQKEFLSQKKVTAQPNLTLQIISNITIPLPPLSEQRRIVEKIDQLMRVIKKYEILEAQYCSLEQAFPNELKKSILQAAMQGRLVEQLESEGDALDLIKEISQEKERLIKQKLLTRPIKLSIITEEEIPFDIPTSWEWMRLNDIADIFNGNSINAQVKKTRYEGLKVGYPYIGTKDVEDNTIVYDNGIKIPYDTSFKVAHKGTTLVCAEGGSAGRKIGFLTEDVCFGNKLFAIQQFKPILNDKFIYYFFQSSLFKTQFNSMITGMIGGVSVSNFKKILIPIPPLAEQKRIVEKLDQLFPACDNLIENL